MPRNEILALLEGGDLRTLGRAEEVAEIVSKEGRLFPKLIAGLWSAERLVRMRAADATEKVTRKHPELLVRYKKELLGLMNQAEEPELRWHLAAIVPRLSLNAKERMLIVAGLNSYLRDRSSIVRTFALQGLADLAHDDKETQAEVIEILRSSVKTGTAAMKARSRKLLLELDHT
jgi:hypothetical protein